MKIGQYLAKIWTRVLCLLFLAVEYDIGKTDNVEYRINTGSHRPIRLPLRKHPFKHLEEIDNRQVEEMKAHGIIEPATSPCASNVVLVKKKDGSVCFCVNYRLVNSVTVQYSYPLSSAAYRQLSECATRFTARFSTLDLITTYRQYRKTETKNPPSSLEEDAIASSVVKMFPSADM